MVACNPTEAQRLIADAHARRDRLDAIRAAISALDSLLYALADQLEASGREVERLTREHQERSKHVLEVEDAATSAERELDSQRQQLEAAQRSESLVSASLESAMAELEIIQGRYQKIRHNARTFCDGFLTIPQPGQHRDRCLPGSGCERMGCPASLQRHDLAVAQRRIADLEAEVVKHREIERLEAERDSLRQQFEGKTSELEFADRTITGALQRIAELDAALDDAIQHDDDAAALRAIYPVYLAAEMLASHIVSQDPEFKALIEAISNASRAITPEILAALKAAGLDAP